MKRFIISCHNIIIILSIHGSRFLCEVNEYSEENKMNTVNLGTIFGPHLLRPNVSIPPSLDAPSQYSCSPQTDDPHVLMECNNTSTDFVRYLLTNKLDLFPLTADERPPNRLSVVVPAGEVAPWIDAPKAIKVHQRSLYTPNSKSRRTGFRPRQNSAPPEHQKRKCEPLSPLPLFFLFYTILIYFSWQ